MYGEINGLRVKFKSNNTIMNVCQYVNIDLPKFCYHEKLSIAGNCRICLVEINNSKKLVIACATYMTNDLKVWTNSLRVQKARFSVMEFLLVNHPLDCPICDQGGECDLQDISMVFGADRGRFFELQKKAVFDKNFGFFIKTSMNRCIHCTKCIRFVAEVSNLYTLGFANRGFNLEITTYIKNFLHDELSGNLIDLCPVGALTSKLYFFEYRSWELISNKFLDIFDSLNSNILVEFYYNKIKRVLPYLNDSLNESWITNKIRFSFDGFLKNLVECCYKRINFFFYFSNKCLHVNAFIKVSWRNAFFFLTNTLFDKNFNFLIVKFGNFVDLETLIVSKLFFNKLGLNSFICNNINTYFNIDFSFFYLFNIPVKYFLKYPTICLLIGSNLRLESPILNFKFKSMVAYYNVKMYSIGLGNNFSTFKIWNISNSLKALDKICFFKHFFCKHFYGKNVYKNKHFPFFVFGNSILENDLISTYILKIYFLLKNIFLSFNFFLNKMLNMEFFNYVNVISNYSNKINAFKVGISNFFLRENLVYFKKNIFYLIESILPINFSKKSVIIYQNSYLNFSNLIFVDLVLPVTNCFEKTFSIVNIEDLVQTIDNPLIINKLNRFKKTNWFIFKALWNFFLRLLKQKKLFYYENNFFCFFKIELNFFNSLVEFRLNYNYFFSKNNYNLNFFDKDNFFLFKLFIFFSIKCINFFEFLNINNPLLHLSNEFYKKKINNDSFLINPTFINYYYDESNLLLLSSYNMISCSNFYFKLNFSFSEYLF